MDKDKPEVRKYRVTLLLTEEIYPGEKPMTLGDIKRQIRDADLPGSSNVEVVERLT